MFGALFRPLARRSVRRLVLAVAVAGAVVVAWACRGNFVHRASAQPAAQPTGTAAPAVSRSLGSDYGDRIVAFIYGNRAITRRDLG
jgi:hypothetical protein